MWKNTYKDYKPDDNWVKESVEPGNGIIGCEMHELNGWGEACHRKSEPKKGWIRSLLHLIFSRITEK